jgi:hypothetical protein
MKVDEQVFALITAIVVAVAGAYVSNKTGADGSSPSAYDRTITDDLLYMNRVIVDYDKSMMIAHLADFLSKQATVIQNGGKSADPIAKKVFDVQFTLFQSMVEKAEDVNVKDHAGETTLARFYPALGYDPATDMTAGMKKFEAQATPTKHLQLVDFAQLNCGDSFPERKACMGKIASTLAVKQDYDTMVFFFPKEISKTLYISVRCTAKENVSPFIVGTFPLTPKGSLPVPAECDYEGVYYAISVPEDIRRHLTRGKKERNEILVTTFDSTTNAYMLDEETFSPRIFAPSYIRKMCSPLFNGANKVFGVFFPDRNIVPDGGDREKDGFAWRTYPHK